MPEIKLKTTGKLISRFDSIELHSSIYALSNMAVLVFNDKDTTELQNARKIIVEDSPAEALIDKELRLKGYISKVKPAYNKDGKACLEVQVSSPVGRYIGACIGLGRYYKAQDVADIIKDLCPDLEIEARQSCILSQFVVYGHEDYTAVFARLCAKGDLLIYSAPTGKLIVEAKSTDNSKIGYLKTGENVISIAPLEIDDNGVTISGQRALDDDVSLDEAIFSSLSLSGKKSRVVYADDISPASLAAMQSKKKRTIIVAPNWFDSNKQLLSLNRKIGVIDPWLGVNQAMLIYALVFRLDRNGYRADAKVEA